MKACALARKKIMTTNGNNMAKPFTVSFSANGAQVFLELTNTTDQMLRGVEILTIFLKDEAFGGGPSRAHITFETIKHIQPQEKAAFSHQTWIDGVPASPEQDQLTRLQAVAGETKPYVLDISWEDAEGKSRYQRIPVGH